MSKIMVFCNSISRSLDRKSKGRVSQSRAHRCRGAAQGMSHSALLTPRAAGVIHVPERTPQSGM